MKAVILPVGSHGDVLPMLGLARSLQAQGAQVSVILNPVFEGAARTAGVPYRLVGTAADHAQAENDPDLRHPTRGLRTVSRTLFKFFEPVYRVLDEEAADADVLIGSSLAFVLRCVAEVRRKPAVTVHLSPSLFRSTLNPPVLTANGLPKAWPRPVLAAFWWLADTLFIDRVLTTPFNRARRQLGLPPVRRMLHHWVHDTDLVLALFPDWFCSPPPDWPQNLRQFGFPLYDVESAAELSPELEQFLQAGPPPVAITGGTGFATQRPFFEAALRDCQREGARCLLLTRHLANLPSRLPPNALHVPYAPFSELLPRTAALVHHGGIGSVSQALRAGVPQVVVPQAHDQFDNAAHVVRLRAGGSLQAALHDPALRERAQLLVPHVRSGLEEAAWAVLARFG